MGAAILIAVLAGFLIPHARTALVGALVLTGATIIFAVAATWRLRPSWDADSWPEQSSDGAVIHRRLRRIWLAQCTLAPLLIAGGIWALIEGRAVGVLWIGIGAFTLYTATSGLKRMQAATDPPGTPE